MAVPVDSDPEAVVHEAENAPLLHDSLTRRSGQHRHLGLSSTISLIFNRIIGTGIFAAPSVILRCSGSVGATFVMWILGTIIAATGTAVYIELGSALPKNGGEKNYLEYIYHQPAYLAACTFAAYAVFTARISMFSLYEGWASANSIVFGEYLINALAIPATRFSVSIAALGCIIFSLVAHGVFLSIGLRIQNILATTKFFILLAIVGAALLNAIGLRYFKLRDGVTPPDNYAWDNLWIGSFEAGVSGFVTGMFNVVWSFNGYQNANYALAEIRNPIHTLKRAAPLAMSAVSALYLMINIAYFGVIAKEDILSSRGIVAATFFRNIFGPGVERILSAAIALSTLGNVLSIVFVQGRVVQELGKEGVLPCASWFASNSRFGSPFRGILTVCIVSSILMLSAPGGDAYLLMINLSYYPIILFNVLLSAGLLTFRVYRSERWKAPFRAWTPAVAVFALANFFMLLAPFVPPPRGFVVYETLPYWLHVVVALTIGSIGGIYWGARWILWPWMKRYKPVTHVE